jgi:hypothetical protein
MGVHRSSTDMYDQRRMPPGRDPEKIVDSNEIGTRNESGCSQSGERRAHRGSEGTARLRRVEGGESPAEEIGLLALSFCFPDTCRDVRGKRPARPGGLRDTGLGHGDGGTTVEDGFDAGMEGLVSRCCSEESSIELEYRASPHGYNLVVSESMA